VDVPSDLGENLDPRYVLENRKYQRYEYAGEGLIRKQKPFECMRPWKKITLGALGEIIPCELDYKSMTSYGRIHNGTSAVSLWKNEKARKFLALFNRGNNEFEICKDCNYKNMMAKDYIVERIGL